MTDQNLNTSDYTLHKCFVKVFGLHIPKKRKKNEQHKPNKKIKIGKDEVFVDWYVSPRKVVHSFQCDVCGKGFKDAAALLYHEIYHPQPYKTSAPPTTISDDEIVSRLSGAGLALSPDFEEKKNCDVKKVRVRSFFDNNIPQIIDYSKNCELVVTKRASSSSSEAAVTRSRGDSCDDHHQLFKDHQSRSSRDQSRDNSVKSKSRDQSLESNNKDHISSTTTKDYSKDLCNSIIKTDIRIKITKISSKQWSLVTHSQPQSYQDDIKVENNVVQDEPNDFIVTYGPGKRPRYGFGSGRRSGQSFWKGHKKRKSDHSQNRLSSNKKKKEEGSKVFENPMFDGSLDTSRSSDSTEKSINEKSTDDRWSDEVNSSLDNSKQESACTDVSKSIIQDLPSSELKRVDKSIEIFENSSRPEKEEKTKAVTENGEEDHNETCHNSPLQDHENHALPSEDMKSRGNMVANSRSVQSSITEAADASNKAIPTQHLICDGISKSGESSPARKTDIELIASTLSSPQIATAAKIVLPKPSSDNVTVNTFDEEVEASSDSDCDDDGQDYLKNLLNPINMSDSDLDEIQAVCEKINSGTASPMPEPSSISHQQKSSHPFNLLENNNTDISMLLGKIDVSSNNLGPAAMFDNVADQPPPTVSGTSTPPIEIYPTFFDDDISEFGLTSGV